MIAVLADTDADRLRDTFRRIEYTVDAVVELIGPQAHAALGRNHTTPGRRRAVAEQSPLATVALLWPLQATVPLGRVVDALGDAVGPLVTAGVLAVDGSDVRALVDVRPYAADDLPDGAGWIVSDLTPNLDGVTTRVRPDFVLGVSSASSTLAQLTLRRPVARALDLGTGCGVQGLHLSSHAQHVVATDVNRRALAMAGLTARLNGVRLDLREGSLYAPVDGEQFDLITANPPYVMSPPGTAGKRLVYREGVEGLDRLVERVVREGVTRLEPGGTLQVLANWAHLRGGDWTERLRGWVAGTGCDVWVLQREVLDPSAYVELWLNDAGLAGSPDFVTGYERWLNYFDECGVTAVGMGWLLLRRTARPDPVLRLEDWPWAVEQPVAPALQQWLDAVDLLAGMNDRELTARRWRVADDVVEEYTSRPGSSDPEHIVLRQQRGLRRAVGAGTALAAVVGACDGELSLRQIVPAVAALIEVGAETLAAEVLPQVRGLIADGLLAPGGL